MNDETTFTEEDVQPTIDLVKASDRYSFMEKHGETDYMRVFLDCCSTHTSGFVIFLSEVPEHEEWHRQRALGSDTE